MKLLRVSHGPVRLSSARTRLANLLRADRPIWLLVILTGLGLGGYLLSSRRPAPPVIRPSRPEQLEPQLRDYVGQTLAWVQERPRSADRQKTLALVYFANGLWPEASLAFSNVARMNPGEPLATLYLAATTQELGDLPGALKLLQQLVARFPAFAPGYSRLGEVAMRLGRTEEAERAFQTLSQLAPNEVRGHAGLGEVCLRKERFSDAVTHLEKAIALDPDAKGAHNLLGLCYRALGRMEEAQAELSLGQNAVTYPMPDAWSDLAAQHMRLIQDQLELANSLGQSGEAGRAVRLLAQALPYHPEHLGLLNSLAIAYNRAGQPDQARQVLQKALTLNPQYLAAHITLSFSLEALNRHEEALAAADRALALSPQTTQAHLAKANALLGMERDQDAVAALQTAARCDPKNGEIQVEIGDVLWRNLQDVTAAFRHYQAATNLQPALAPAHVRIADLHLRHGDTNAARTVLSTLRRIAPRNPDLLVLEDRWRRSVRSN